MNTTTKNEATLEAARRAVIDSLTCSDRKVEAGSDVKDLNATSLCRPTFRSMRLLVMI